MPHTQVLGESAGGKRVADDERDGKERGRGGEGVLKDDWDKPEGEIGE
jgi:hypothetical protein